MSRSRRGGDRVAASREVYRGDEALTQLLAKSGVSHDAAWVRGLLQGVLAAPVAEDPASWVQLVAAGPSPALKAQLLALEGELRAAARPAPLSPAERLARLRAELARRGLAGFIVPRGDEHQGEYVPPRAERLAWLTGFTGSAGVAVVLAERAAVFVDGRYTLQVRNQTEASLYEPLHLTDNPPAEWIARNLPRGGVLGYDPWLHTPAELERYAAAAAKAGE